MEKLVSVEHPNGMVDTLTGKAYAELGEYKRYHLIAVIAGVQRYHLIHHDRDNEFLWVHQETATIPDFTTGYATAFEAIKAIQVHARAIVEVVDFWLENEYEREVREGDVVEESEGHIAIYC